MAESTWWGRLTRTVEREPDSRLSAGLGIPSVMLLAVGAVVGTGVFVILGVAVPIAGPAIVLSFVVAGAACMLSGLSYAEVASSLPSSGSVYSYAYASVGEGLAWVVGWCLILEYSIGLSAVSVGWSAYFDEALYQIFGITLPAQISGGPADGGWVNLPAVAVILVGAWVVSRGVESSARANAALVCLKLGLLAFFCIVAFTGFQASHFNPFLATGLAGMLAASSQLVFAYGGFDAAAVAGGEARNPRRAIPLAIIGALGLITVVYVVVATAAIGAWPWTEFAGKSGDASLTLIAQQVSSNAFIGEVMSVGIVVAIVSSVLAVLYTLSRIVFSISRDGLLPPRFGSVSPRTHTPVFSTWTLAAFIALAAAFLPLDILASAVSLGTLFAFLIVNVAVLVLRRTRPELPRGFRIPFGPVIPVVAILVNAYLMSRIRASTWLVFAAWLAVGIAVYLAYGQRHARAGIESIIEEPDRTSASEDG